MSDAFFGRLVPSEDLVIKTASLAISLKKVSADDVKGLDMEEGPSKFKFPSNLGNMGGENVNAKVNRPVLSRCPLKQTLKQKYVDSCWCSGSWSTIYLASVGFVCATESSADETLRLEQPEC